MRTPVVGWQKARWKEEISGLGLVSGKSEFVKQTKAARLILVDLHDYVCHCRGLFPQSRQKETLFHMDG